MDNPDVSADKQIALSQQKPKFSIKIILIPVIVALFIIAYEDFLNNVVVQPFIYLLQNLGIITNLQSGTNEYALVIILLNLVLNFASLFLIYFLFFRTKLLSKQVENKQYGLALTIKTYLGLFALVSIFAVIVTILQQMYFPSIPTTSPYDAIFPSSSNYSYLNLILVVLLVCFFAPILEELTFRRILIPLLEGTSLVSTSYAVVISATVFAFIHSESDLLDGSLYFAFVHFVSAFILGLGLAGVYASTRNIKYSMFYHGLNNSLAMITTIISAYFITKADPTPSILIYFDLIVFGLLIAGVVFLIIGIIHSDRVKYPLVNQFKAKITNAQMSSTLIIILVIQGIIFIAIPYLEDFVLSITNLDPTTAIVLNAALYCIIFGSFLIFLRKNLQLIVTFGKVQNKSLPVYVDPKLSYMQQYPYQTYPNQPNQPYQPYQPNQPYQPYNPNVYQPNQQNQPYQPYNPNVYQQNAYTPPNQTPISKGPVETKLSNCPNCAQTLPKDNPIFCPYCGFKINYNPNMYQQDINYPPTQTPNYQLPGSIKQSVCPNCNKTIPTDNPAFCPFCGFKIK